jgi:hypothetical protein
MTMTRRARSTGEMISTLCYVGVGLWTLGTALESAFPEAVVLGLCALASFAGALRHQIARLFEHR